mgnify:CR=1 FL=1
MGAAAAWAGAQVRRSSSKTAAARRGGVEAACGGESGLILRGLGKANMCKAGDGVDMDQSRQPLLMSSVAWIVLFWNASFIC